jgi:uncharacterized Tic20 family protein
MLMDIAHRRQKVEHKVISAQCKRMLNYNIKYFTVIMNVLSISKYEI